MVSVAQSFRLCGPRIYGQKQYKIYQQCWHQSSFSNDITPTRGDAGKDDVAAFAFAFAFAIGTRLLLRNAARSGDRRQVPLPRVGPTPPSAE
jgi:hypothetical protein